MRASKLLKTKKIPPNSRLHRYTDESLIYEYITFRIHLPTEGLKICPSLLSLSDGTDL